MNSTNQELLDRYLTDQLSASELTAFQDKMRQDQQFAQEVQHESLIRDGLVQYRKVQLKARLDAVHVGSGWGSGLLAGSQWIPQVLGGAAAIAMIGILYTNISGYDEPVQLEEKAPITRSTIPAESVNEDASPLNETIQPEPEALVESQVDKTDKLPVIKAEPKELITVPQPAIADESTEKVEEEVTFVPQVTIPGLAEVGDSQPSAGNIDMPATALTDEKSESRDPLDVKSYQKKSSVLRYKYFEGKLYLYGDFKDQPYEILEINKVSERKIFVYHHETYYVVQVTDKIKDLPVVEDPKLKSELEILRSNKF